MLCLSLESKQSNPKSPRQKTTSLCLVMSFLYMNLLLKVSPRHLRSSLYLSFHPHSTLARICKLEYNVTRGTHNQYGALSRAFSQSGAGWTMSKLAKSSMNPLDNILRLHRSELFAVFAVQNREDLNADVKKRDKFQLQLQLQLLVLDYMDVGVRNGRVRSG